MESEKEGGRVREMGEGRVRENVCERERKGREGEKERDRK